MSYYPGGGGYAAPTVTRGTKKNGRNSGWTPTTKLVVFIAVVAVLLGGVLLYLQLSKTGEPVAAECMVLVDRTGSTKNEAVQAQYEGYAKRAIEGCKDLNANLQITYFANDGQNLQSASGDEPIPLNRPVTHRKSVGEEEQAEQVAKAEEAVASIFETAVSDGGRGSAILEAINGAATALQSQARQDGVEDMYLVVVTDGYQTGPLGMKAAFTGPDSKVGPLVKESAGQIPALDGVQVSFAGVSAGLSGDNERVPAWFDAKVHEYWQQIVERGGGQVCIYNSSVPVLPAAC